MFRVRGVMASADGAEMIDDGVEVETYRRVIRGRRRRIGRGVVQHSPRLLLQ